MVVITHLAHVRNCVDSDTATDLAGVLAPARTPGPAESWEAIVQSHHPYVYQHALRLTKNRQDAEDLTQETFIRVFHSWSTYKPGNLEGWLYRITRNLFLNKVRAAKRRPTCVLIDEATAMRPSTCGTPADILDEHQFNSDVETALDAVTPVFRAAVILSDVVGLPRAEIADILGVKLATVATRVYRGREQLRVSLAHRRRTSPGPAELQPTGFQSTQSGN